MVRPVNRLITYIFLEWDQEASASSYNLQVSRSSDFNISS